MNKNVDCLSFLLGGLFFALGNGANEAEARRCASGTAGPAKPENTLKIIKNKVTNRNDNFKMLL